MNVTDLVLHRIAGTALQLEAGLRPARLLRAELWTSARAGWLQAEQLTLAKTTVHRHLQALRLGVGEVGSSRVTAGPPVCVQRYVSGSFSGSLLSPPLRVAVVPGGRRPALGRTCERSGRSSRTSGPPAY